MKKLLLLSVALFSLNALGAQSLIAVQHDGQSSFFTELQLALDAAADGDTVYLPGGGFPEFTLTKSLHIVGVGYHPDSTMATGASIVPQIFIENIYTNASITGIRVGNIGLGKPSLVSVEINDLEISRCYIDAVGRYSQLTLKGLVFKNNVVASPSAASISLSDGNLERLLFVNNIFVSNFRTKNAEVFNNIFLYASSSPIEVSNCKFVNNVFYGYSDLFNPCLAPNSFFYNNLNNGINGASTGCGTQGSNNYLNTPPTFVNYSGSGFSFTNDFHLTTNYLGTDGTPVGIYGGLYPWKAGGVPYTPHIQTKTIAPTTNAQGSLNVQIRVAAQDH